jgi:hypothetical protein
VTSSGGNGLDSAITGPTVGRAGGGAGGGANYSGLTLGSQTDGGGGTASTGGGGRGGGNITGGATAGGSGFICLSYPSDYTISLAGGAASSAGEQTDAANNRKYIEIQSSGTVSWVLG